jgi:integrase
VVQNLRSALRAAVADRIIASSPAVGLRLPSLEAGEVVPLHPEELVRLVDAMPERYRAAAWLGAGSGLRQGELFGLTVDRVDFLRRTLRVASVLIRAGISVKEVSARLGHKAATTTLQTYAHLWPNDDDRTRQAVETKLRPDQASMSSPAALSDSTGTELTLTS